MPESITQSRLNKSHIDKFIMVLTMPKAMRQIDVKENPNRYNNVIMSDSLQFSVYGSVLPDIKVPEIEAPYSGQTVKMTSYNRPSYPNITLNFDIDNEYNNWWVIYTWLNLLNDEQTSIFNEPVQPTPKPDYEQYATNCTLYGLDEYNNRKIQFDYIGVVPVSLGGISYTERDKGQISSTFEFSFTQLHTKLI